MRINKKINKRINDLFILKHFNFEEVETQ